MSTLYLRKHAKPEETRVTTATLASLPPQPDPRIGAAYVPAPLAFTILNGYGDGDLGQAFSDSLAQARAEADAAIRDEQRALAAAADRARTRLDLFQHCEDAAFTAARKGNTVPPLAPLPVAEAAEPAPPASEPAPALPPAQEAALANFNAAHDETAPPAPVAAEAETPDGGEDK